MVRLHNRQIKAGFWTDTVLQFDLDVAGRCAYLGLIQIADDSGCLEDDPRAFKLLLFAMDDSVGVEALSEYRDRLVALGKLVPYVADGKRCLFLRNFHKHQVLRSPSGPEVPLPPWVVWHASEVKHRSGAYSVDLEALATVRFACGDSTESVAGSGSSSGSGSLVRIRNLRVSTAEGYSEDFEEFWAAYPRRVEKRRAWRCWQVRLKEGVDPAVLVRAARHYGAYVRQTGAEERHVKHGSTFLGPDRPFEDWVEPRSVPVREVSQYERNKAVLARFIVDGEREEDG